MLLSVAIGNENTVCIICTGGSVGAIARCEMMDWFIGKYIAHDPGDIVARVGTSERLADMFYS